MNIEIILVALGLLGGFSITIATIIWKMATLASRIDKNENTAKIAHERLDRYVSKYESSIDEMKQQIHTFMQTQARIEEKLSFLIEANKKN